MSDLIDALRGIQPMLGGIIVCIAFLLIALVVKDSGGNKKR